MSAGVLAAAGMLKGMRSPRRPGARHQGTFRSAEAQPFLVLVTDSAEIHDELALIAAVVGLRLEVTDRWSALPAGAEDAVAVACSPSMPPPTGYSGTGALVVGHNAEAVWAVAAAAPDLRPVPLPQAERWLSEHLSAEALHRTQGRVAAVASTAGGTGASTCAYLGAAECAVRGGRPLVIDAALGVGSGLASLVRVTGAQGASRSREDGSAGLDWSTLLKTDGEISAAHLAAAVPEIDGIGCLTGPADPRGVLGLLPAVVQASRRAYDLVVVDLGQRTETLRVLGAATDHLTVVSRAAPRAAKAAQQLGASRADGLSLFLNRRPAPGWGPAEMSQVSGISVAGELAEQKWLARSDDLSESYELLRAPRGAAVIAGLLQAWGVADA